MKLLLLACLIATTSAGIIQYMFDNVNDVGYYKAFEFKKTWVDALGYCQSQGGHLATVNSPEEAEAIKKLMTKNNIPYYAFIGFSDIVRVGDYITVEGQDIDHSGYTKWEGGLHLNAAWKCGAFTPAGELTNRDCNEELPFICEKDIWSQWVQLPEQGSVYKLHREKLTWAEALEKCHSQQATLAVMNSDAEAEFVSKKVMKAVKSVHVGIHDMYFEAFYSTVEGGKMEESGYNKWVVNQPYKTYSLNYVSMNNKGLYELENETNKLAFVCEKHL